MIQAVTFNTIGRFGNNLFQYAAARLLANLLGVNFHSSINASSYYNIIEDIRHPIIGPVKALNDYDFKHIIQNIDNPEFRKSLCNSEAQAITLSGYFQYSWVYNKYKDLTRSFFILPEQEVNDKDLVMHIRLGDFFHSHYNSEIIDPQWYIDIINQQSYEKLYIVVEAPTNIHEENYLANFKEFNPIIVSGSLIDDFNFLRKFKKTIVSNSTFSWWATFLGVGEDIILPENYNYFGVTMSGHHDHQEIYEVRGLGKRIPCKFVDIYPAK